MLEAKEKVNRRVRLAAASALWGVARVCDRCCEILEG